MTALLEDKLAVRVVHQRQRMSQCQIQQMVAPSKAKIIFVLTSKCDFHSVCDFSERVRSVVDMLIFALGGNRFHQTIEDAIEFQLFESCAAVVKLCDVQHSNIVLWTVAISDPFPCSGILTRSASPERIPVPTVVTHVMQKARACVYSHDWAGHVMT